MRQLEELQFLNDEERALLKRCSDIIRDIEPSAELILYGSRARGDAEPESDYDLLILIDGEANFKKEELICRKIYPIELETGKALTAIVYNRQLWNGSLYRAMPFHKNIERDGAIV